MHTGHGQAQESNPFPLLPLQPGDPAQRRVAVLQVCVMLIHASHCARAAADALGRVHSDSAVLVFLRNGLNRTNRNTRRFRTMIAADR